MIYEEIPHLYKVIVLNKLRRTKDVEFDALDTSLIPHIDAVDRVIHHPGAFSPGAVGDLKRPWYMHEFQEDNLMVLHGTRYVDLYAPWHGKVERFTVSPDKIVHNDELCYSGPVMLAWPRNVFHRIVSCPEVGSASVNFASRYEGFDINTNFSIYDLNTETGEYKVIREGHLDQNF